MQFLKLFLALFMFSIQLSQAESCHIKLAPILLFMSKTMTPFDWQPVMKSSNCSPEITLNILEKLKDAEGKIYSEQLVSGYPVSITITPNHIEVINLETLLRSKTENYFKKITINGSLTSRLVLLDSFDQVKLECKNCETTQWNHSNFGKKGDYDSTLAWQLQLTSPSLTQNLLITTEVALMKKVLRSKNQLENSMTLNSDSFEISYISVNPQDKVFDPENTHLENFILIKPLSRGEVLTLNHVQPKKLVTIGKTIDAIIKNKGIELTLPAQALQSGSMGQTIQVKNLKNKKQLSAEIIGENKVLINL
jgi:flagella basal body P-ring formation protein FlgA